VLTRCHCVPCCACVTLSLPGSVRGGLSSDSKSTDNHVPPVFIRLDFHISACWLPGPRLFGKLSKMRRLQQLLNLQPALARGFSAQGTAARAGEVRWSCIGVRCLVAGAGETEEPTCSVCPVDCKTQSILPIDSSSRGPKGVLDVPARLLMVESHLLQPSMQPPSWNRSSVTQPCWHFHHQDCLIIGSALQGPGPANAHPRVLAAMSLPLLGHM
jgi:hypothetical protein